jgi:CubicO group peptidase (beta-lactamase class C family)
MLTARGISPGHRPSGAGRRPCAHGTDAMPQQSRTASTARRTGKAALKAAVDRLVRDTGIRATDPGIAVLVTRPEGPLLMQGYGRADLKRRVPITPCTRFELASVSKIFTATAVLLLHDRGLISIDDDVRKYIPELPRYGKKPVRIRDMLRHASGLPHYFRLEDVPRRNKTYLVNADYLNEFARQRPKFPLRFPTGQKFEYSNSNFMLLAIVIERASKKPLGQFLRDVIFAPLGMDNTFVYSSPDSVPANSAPPCSNAVGYQRGKRTWVATWGTAPDRSEEHLEVGDGGIWSNLEDMAKWDAAVRANTLLKAATMRLMLTPSKTADGKTNPYGLGWWLYADRVGRLYGLGHDGYWQGFTTSYYYYLIEDHSVVLLSNRGKSIDLNKFWDKLNRLIRRYAPLQR